MWDIFRVLLIASILPVLTSSALSEVPLAAVRQLPDLSPVRRSAPEALSGPILMAIRTENDLTDPAPLTAGITASLNATYGDFEQRLGGIPAVSASIRLADDKTFAKLTGAPRWTAAVYFRKEIVIRLDHSARENPATLDHAVRHEFTHAIISTLSGGNCPGWLDEGLAQWAESVDSATVKPPRKKLLRKHLPIRLSLLQEGFTRMSSEMVAPSYAQSLFATRQAIDSFGFSRIRTFLDKLKEGRPQSIAFEEAFLISEAAFEDQLNLALHK